MKFKHKTLIAFFLSLIFGVFIFIYVGHTIGWESIKNAFNIFTKWDGFFIILISFSIAFISAFRWGEILKDYGVKNINLWQLYKIYLGGFSITYLFPMILLGSEAFRSYALHEQSKIGWPKITASVISERIIEWTINVFVILIAVLYFFYAIAKPSQEVLIIILFSILVVFLLMVFIYFYIFNKNSLIHKIVRKFNKEIHEENVALKTEKELFSYFNFKNKGLWKAYLLSILRVFLLYARVWLILFFLGKALTFLPTFSILGFSFVSLIVPIPATLGFQELIQAFVFSSLGLGASVSTAFTMILRSGDVLVSIVGLILVFSVGIKFLKEKFNGK